MIDLSVAMIARNEALVLERALRSVADLAREIVLIDTGSTDNTTAIAERYGARVFRFDWQDDFAAARNAGLEQARGQWILVLDCDEELCRNAADVAALTAACAASETSAYLVEIENLQRDGGLMVHAALRLFRNDPRIRFANPVHESVGESVYTAWPSKPITTAGFRLRHHGYAGADNASKAARNERILKLWLEREPLNIYASYKYGLALAYRGDTGAIEWLGRGFELLDREADRASFPFRLALSQAFISELRRYGLADEAERATRRAERW